MKRHFSVFSKMKKACRKIKGDYESHSHLSESLSLYLKMKEVKDQFLAQGLWQWLTSTAASRSQTCKIVLELVHCLGPRLSQKRLLIWWVQFLHSLFYLFHGKGGPCGFYSSQMLRMKNHRMDMFGRNIFRIFFLNIDCTDEHLLVTILSTGHHSKSENTSFSICH